MNIHHITTISFTLRRAAAAALALLALSVPASAGDILGRGAKSFGPRVGYVSRNNSINAGLEFQIATAEHVRLAPEIGIVFRHNNKDAFNVGLNVHFPFEVAPRFVLYPLVGAEYVSWGLHGMEPETYKDVTTHANRFGANVGAGAEYYCTPTLKLSLSGRYNIVNRYSTAIVQAGISYVF